MTFAPLHHPHRRIAARQNAWLSAIIPLAFVLAENSIIFVTRSQGGDEAFRSAPFSPSAWLVAVMWLVIYPMWGLARWKTARSGRAGRRESWWVVALMAWGLAYPLLTGFRTGSSAWANLASLVLVAVTLWRVSTVSRKAAALIIPSVAWIAFATVIGFEALARA